MVWQGTPESRRNFRIIMAEFDAENYMDHIRTGLFFGFEVPNITDWTYPA